MGTDDRYPVPVSDPFVRYEERIKALEQAVREMKAARPLRHTTLTGGGVNVIDPASDDAVKIGLVRSDSEGDKYGLTLSAAGAVLFEVNSIDGFRQPGLPLLPIPQKTLGAGPFVTSTSATFENAWKMTASALTHRAIKVAVDVTTAASTTAELRLRHGASGTVTGVIAIPAGTATSVEWLWLHAQTLASGPHAFYLEVRRASGAGSVTVFWPDESALITPQVATEDGL